MGKLHINIKQGESFAKAMRIKDDTGTPLSLDGATVTAQIRKASTDALVADFDVELLEDDWYELSLTAEVTAEIAVDSGLHWDSRVQFASGEVFYTERDSVTIQNTITATA